MESQSQTRLSAHTHTRFHLEPRWSGETLSLTDSQFPLSYVSQAIQSHVPQLSPLSGSHTPLRSLSTHPNHPGTRYQTNAESLCGPEHPGVIHTGQAWARAACLPCPRLLTLSVWLLLTLVLPSVTLRGWPAFSASVGTSLFLHGILSHVCISYHPWLKQTEVKGKDAQPCPTLGNPMKCRLLAPPSVGLSKQEYWTGLPCPSSGDLPDPGVELGPELQPGSLPSETW